MPKHRVCPHIGTQGLHTQTLAAADWTNGQFADQTAIRGQKPNNEPVTLCNSLPKAVPL